MADVLKGLEIKNMTDVSADLYFYGDIVSDWWGAWQNEDQYPDAIKNFLSQAEGKDLNVYVNSGGGSVFAGMAIYNMIKRHGEKNKVKVYVDGLAGSIASVIAFAGTEPPEIPSNAFLMIHKPWGAISGNADEMRKMADDLDKIQTGIMNVYEDHLAEGVTIDQVETLVNAETWLDGKEAAKYFNIAQTDAADYVAAVGDYLNYAGKLPEKFKSHQKQPEQTPKGPTPEEQAKAAADAEKRNQIKRLCIEGMTKGD
jgi:ATP-dependent Clp endopeptidase proteolytic subunit ClpP